jgi:hypothetical protein
MTFWTPDNLKSALAGAWIARPTAPIPDHPRVRVDSREIAP